MVDGPMRSVAISRGGASVGHSFCWSDMELFRHDCNARQDPHTSSEPFRRCHRYYGQKQKLCLAEETMYVERRSSFTSRPGLLIGVIAVHLAIAYLLSVSMGVIKMPAVLEASKIVFIPEDNPVQPEPEIPVVKPEIAQQDIETPMPQIEMPQVETPVEAPPSDTAPVAATEPAVSSPPAQTLQVRSRAEPVYPPASRRAGEEGTVKLRILVDERGAPRQVELLRGSGFDRLDQAAIDAVRKWRFKPASSGGQNITAWTQVAVTFRLQDA